MFCGLRAAQICGDIRQGATLSITPEFNETQLAAARARAWHQDGEQLLTLEAVRDYVNACGLVLFAPRSQQLPVPAPSLVEATLGAANQAPTLAETDTARTLVARLTGEGLALPLNLLSVPGDMPDFVVSAQVFSYVFTMRGDKAWKLPPSTSGAVKVSPLSLRVYEVLAEKGPMTALELASELGREVTETAILRSLSELWSQLRVIPLLQQGAASTLWELSTRRFTKAIKAGANAGQPTALSALISLYLAQVVTAAEEEVMTFLSPLTARSRVREVLHALVGARQLETSVVEGKSLLYIPGTLPAFGAGEGAAVEAEETPVARPKKIGTGRISSFTSEQKTASEFRGKSATAFAKPARAFKSAAASKYGPRLDGKSEPARRPFKKDGTAPVKRTFTKPWDEDRKQAARKSAGPDSFSKFRRPAPEDREPLGAREQAGLPEDKRSYSPKKASFDRAAKPAYGRAAKPGGFAKRPYTPRATEEGERPAFKPRSYERRDGEGTGKAFTKKPYAPRTTEGGAKPFAAKRPYTSRSAEGGEAQFAAKRPYTPRAEGEAPKRSFAVKTPYASQSAEGGERPYAKRTYTPRTTDAGEGSSSKRAYSPRTSDVSEGSFPKRAYKPRSAEGSTSSPGSYPKRAYTPRPAVDHLTERTFAKRPYKPRAADADSRPFNKTPWTPTEDAAAKPKRNFKQRSEGGGSRPGGSFARAGAGPRKPFGAKPGGKFGKPFGKSGTKAPVRRKPDAE
jgi:23S rRNA pseudouridine2605 synthase